MGFNIQAAKKEGYSDEEIKQFLQQNHPNFNVEGALKEGYSLDDIGSELSNPKPQGSDNLAEQSSRMVRDAASLPIRLPMSAMNPNVQAIPNDLKQTISQYAKPIVQTAKDFYPGFVESASMGAIKNPQANPDGEIVSPQTALARGAGRLVGNIPPILAAEATGGVSAELGALKAGLGPAKTAILRGLGTGATLGAAEGAAQNKGILPTVQQSGTTGLGFGAMATGGQALGYLRNLLGNSMADSIFNKFLNTDKGVANKLARNGEPSLGAQALDYEGQRVGDKVFRGIPNRGEALNTAKDELAMLQNRSRGIIDTLNEKAKAPAFSDVRPMAQPPKTDGPGIDLHDVANDLDPMIASFQRVGKETGPASGFEKIKQDFIDSNPKIADIGDAIKVKSTLDRIVSDAYNNKLIDNSQKDKVYRTLANGIRQRVYAISPDLGANFDKQALMHDISTGLEPTQAETGKLGGFFWWKSILNALEDSPVGSGSASALKATMGQPSKFVAPIARYSGRSSLMELQRDENR